MSKLPTRRTIEETLVFLRHARYPDKELGYVRTQTASRFLCAKGQPPRAMRHAPGSPSLGLTALARLMLPTKQMFEQLRKSSFVRSTKRIDSVNRRATPCPGRSLVEAEFVRAIETG